MISFYEAIKHNSMRSWQLTGKRRLVKVVSRERARDGLTGRVGYVTQERYLEGRNPHQIERDLGLKPNTLIAGACVYALQRLPALHEFECRLSAAFPDGAVFDWKAVSDSDFERRDFWPPGAAIPQWEVLTAMPTKLMRTVLPFEPY